MRERDFQNFQLHKVHKRDKSTLIHKSLNDVVPTKPIAQNNVNNAVTNTKPVQKKETVLEKRARLIESLRELYNELF